MAHRDPPEHVGYMIGDVSRMFRTAYDRHVEPLGLTRAQWRVLSRINRMEGCTQTDLASVLEIEKPTLGRLLDKLEEKSWVERRPDEHDGRTKRIFLTEAAQPVLRQMYEMADEVLGAAVAGLSKSETDELRGALEKIKGNLTTLLNNPADGEGD